MRKVLNSLPSKRYFFKLLVGAPSANAWIVVVYYSSSCISHASFPLAFCFISDFGRQDYIETVIPSNQLPGAAFFSETQRQFSRYFNEFEELQLLGKGAFGAVIKVWYRVVPVPFRAPALFHFCTYGLDFYSEREEGGEFYHLKLWLSSPSWS